MFNKKKKVASCEKCKCLILKKDAYIVKLFVIVGFLDGYFGEYYCRKCKPKYDSIYIDFNKDCKPTAYKNGKKINIKFPRP